MGSNVKSTVLNPLSSRNREKKILEVENLSRLFRSGLYFGTRFKAVENFNISLGKDSSVLMVVGESGCGKTTFANIILGLLEPTTGVVKYKGKDIYRLKGLETKWFRQEVQPIFQDPFETFNPFIRTDYYLVKTALKFNPNIKSKEDAVNLMEKTLEKVGLEMNVTGKYPHEFSGGELQRLSIARAIMSNPSLLVADEPVSMIDASLRIEVLNFLIDLVKDFNLSLVFITHDLSISYYIAANLKSDMVIIYRGEIVEQGDPERIFAQHLHPYTITLIESVPPHHPEKNWLSNGEEKGAVLELEEFNLRGCKFAKRCPHAKDICFKRTPPLSFVNGEKVRCWLYE